jgi:hypothetical protein
LHGLTSIQGTCFLAPKGPVAALNVREQTPLYLSLSYCGTGVAWRHPRIEPVGSLDSDALDYSFE